MKNILNELIEKAIIAMEKKQRTNYEPIIDTFIYEYKCILEKIDLDKNDLRKIKSFTRTYIETSSRYNENFLNELYIVEKYIKEFDLK